MHNQEPGLETNIARTASVREGRESFGELWGLCFGLSRVVPNEDHGVTRSLVTVQRSTSMKQIQ